MEPSGSDEPDILIVGEAPGEIEDKLGEPFVGKAGKLLREVLDAAEVDISTVAFTNVVRCRPPDNVVSKKAIMACRQFAVDDIDYYQPRIVMLMGNSPLNGILGESGISNWNGSVINRDGIKYVPLYHPAYILRDASKTDEWLQAMVMALDDAEEKDAWEYNFPETTDDVLLMANTLRKEPEIVVDIETSSLDPFKDISAILSISFAIKERCWSLPLDHPESWWTDEEYALVMETIKTVLGQHSSGDNKLIGHNTKFDIMFTNGLLGTQFKIGGDTMLISHLLNSMKGIHGLKHLAAVNLNMYDYDREIEDYKRGHPEADPERGGSYAFIPLDKLLKYGGLDAKATWLINDLFLPQLSDKQKILYEDVIIPTSNMLCTIQSNGLLVDRYVAKRYSCIYKMLQGEEYEAILDDKHVQKITAKKQTVLDGAYKAKASKSKRAVKKNVFKFNPNSFMQLSELYFDYYKMPVVGTSKKTGKPTTSGKAYRKYEPDYPILGHIRMYKMMNKMLSTYLNPAANGEWESNDGRVHPTYNQHGTRTGRLSSSQPFNAQNIPTPEKEPGTILETLPIKNIFTHSDWWDRAGNDDDFDTGALVAADYSGMELRVFASLANCQLMIDIHKSGLDFHKMVAALSLHYLTKNDVAHAAENTKEVSKILEQVDKPTRYRYKWTNWTLLYGGDAYTLHRLYDVDLDDAEDTIKIYYDSFPEVLEYREWTQEFAEDHGYIESPFGRREHLPYINSKSDQGKRNKDRRVAVNMPVQSGASEILLIAGVILDKKMQERSMASMLVNTVHDSLLGDCPRYEIVPFADLCCDVMTNVASYAKIYMPRIDFSWLKSPLMAEVDVGTHYGNEISLELWREQYDRQYSKVN
jgi:DNA polymerase-1